MKISHKMSRDLTVAASLNMPENNKTGNKLFKCKWQSLSILYPAIILGYIFNTRVVVRVISVIHFGDHVGVKVQSVPDKLLSTEKSEVGLNTISVMYKQ